MSLGIGGYNRIISTWRQYIAHVLYFMTKTAQQDGG